MLTCKELAEIVTDYQEGRMAFGKRMSFWLHISMCRHFRVYIRQMKLTIATLGKMPREPIPPQVREDLLARFRDWKK
ncbi:MAG: anti-sigma factor [Deltaproteobacteria bacterium]|nr:anti-sigma factor [Deltaproteobacteria bacterium]